MHNNIDEIIEAQVTAQVVRLSSTKAGRRILDEVGMAPRIMEERRITLTRETRETSWWGPSREMYIHIITRVDVKPVHEPS